MIQSFRRAARGIFFKIGHLPPSPRQLSLTRLNLADSSRTQRAVNAGRNPHFFAGMRKRGTRFAVASATARRRTVGGQRRQTNKLCQGLQPPKAGPTAAFTEFIGLSRSAIRGAGWRPHNVMCRQKSADLHRRQQERAPTSNAERRTKSRRVH